MARLKIPHLTYRLRADGTRRHFWQPSAALRRKGFLLKRLSDDPREALAAAIAENARVAAILKASPAPAAPAKMAPDSVRAMIEAYRRSAKFARLAPKTKRGYLDALAALDRWAGDRNKREITPALAAEWYEALKSRRVIGADGQPIREERLAQAAQIIRVARLVYYNDRRIDGHLRSPDEAVRNPFAMLSLELRRPGERKGGGDPRAILWDEAALAAYIETADAIGLPSIGTAILMNFWLGQRLGDVIRLPAAMAESASLTLRQNKTGAFVDLDWRSIPDLAKRIAEERARRDARAASGELKAAPASLLVSEATGLPYSEDHFRKKFETVRRAIAARYPGEDGENWGKLTFMHLRHSAVVAMAEAGADILAIASVTGHTPERVQQIIRHYMVRTRKLSRLAFSLRLAGTAGR